MRESSAAAIAGKVAVRRQAKYPATTDRVRATAYAVLPTENVTYLFSMF
jgi:hypothetical protein